MRSNSFHFNTILDIFNQIFFGVFSRCESKSGFGPTPKLYIERTWTNFSYTSFLFFVTLGICIFGLCSLQKATQVPGLVKLLFNMKTHSILLIISFLILQFECTSCLVRWESLTGRHHNRKRLMGLSMLQQKRSKVWSPPQQPHPLTVNSWIMDAWIIHVNLKLLCF